MRYRNTWEEATIEAAEQVAADVMQLKISPQNGTQKFMVGAHLDVSVLINDIPEIRSYSLVGSYEPNAPYTIAVKRLSQSRGGSQYMWRLRKGSRLKISQPNNHFELDYGSPDYLLIAGGIGITPIFSMAQQLARRTDKKIRMLYLGNSKKDMPFVEKLQDLLGGRLTLHYSDNAGLYDTTKILDLVDDQTKVYLCGPIGLMNAVCKNWEESPFDTTNLRYETFGASGLFAPQNLRLPFPGLTSKLRFMKTRPYSTP